MNRAELDMHLDQLAEIVEGVMPGDHDDAQALVLRKDWSAPVAATEIVSAIHREARSDLAAFIQVVGDGDEAEVVEAWLSSDPTPGAPWGLDHRIANVINHALYQRGLPAGDWTWLEWMRVMRGEA